MITGNSDGGLEALSTDDKMDPFAINFDRLKNGTTLVEMDTGKVFKWDAEGKRWREF